MATNNLMTGKVLALFLVSVFLIGYLYVNNTFYFLRWDSNYEPTFSKQAECPETKSLLYVKTHKTASSTILMILESAMNQTYRTLPRPFVGGYPGLFNKNFVETLPTQAIGQGKRMLANHLRFNKAATQSFMPPMTKYVTIIRHPLRQFESAFHYYYKAHGNSKLLLERIPCFATPYYQVLNKFNASLTEYIDTALTSLNDSIPWYFRSKNYQSFDLGMDPKRTNDEAYIRSYVEELDSTFDLIMISEYFYESLVLLRETLCLDWDQLVFHKCLVGRYEKHVFTAEEEKKLRRFLNQDFILYEHMNKTFWKKVEKYGRKRMENDILSLKARILELERRKSKIKKTENDITAPVLNKTNALEVKIEDEILSKSDIRRTKKNMLNLIGRIKQECPCEMNYIKIRQLADYMADSGGYCPF